MTKRRVNLAIARLERGMTQAELAARVGVCRSYYTQIEAGKRTPGRNLGRLICSYLGLDTLDQPVTGENFEKQGTP